MTETNQPLTSFLEKPTDCLRDLHVSKASVTLLIDGKPEAILLNPEVYQRLLDLAALGSAEEGIRQGLANIAAGRARPAEEVFAELHLKYGIRG